MSGKSSNVSWRDQYLLLLEQQEKNEKRVAAQGDQIRRLLKGFAAFVDQVDEPLSRRLSKYQQQPGLSGADVDALEQSVKASLNRRREGDQRYRDSFKHITETLLKSGGPGINKKALRGLQGNLTDAQYLFDILPLSTHLANCLEPALTGKPVAKQNWLKSFLGRYAEDSNNKPVEGPAAGFSQSQQTETSQRGEGERDLKLDDMSPEVPLGKDLDNSPRPSFISELEGKGGDDFDLIAPRVERVLTELIDRVEPQVCVMEKVAAARARLANGLSWGDLVPTLEEIRDLIFQAYLEADSNFRDYLMDLEQQLVDILKLAGGVANLDASDQAGRALATNVRNESDTLANVLASTQETERVKLAVDSYLEAIYTALKDYDGKTRPAEQQTDATLDSNSETTLSLSEQLANLMAKIESMEGEVKNTRDELVAEREKALLDPLTQLPNREAYNQRVNEEFMRWQRYRRPLTLAICDIDKFKTINDTYGHQVGDRVLQVFAKALSKRLREVDFLGRFGGEEFVVLLPETSSENALVMLEKIRVAIGGLPFSFKGVPVQVTLSIGIAEFMGDETQEHVFARADKALYDAKAAGRNKCILAEAPEQN